MTSHPANSPAFDYYPRLNRVRKYVLEHLETGFNVYDVAQVAGLERHYFSSFFRHRVGLGFMEWVTQVRVLEAQALIRHQDIPITTVAYAVGFGSLRTFERSFRRYAGCSAREYRQQVRLTICP